MQNCFLCRYTLSLNYMEANNYLKESNASSLASSRYFKQDFPTGEKIEGSCKNTLCQCGKSKNKPFCDESHTKCFLDTSSPWF
jgi:CDGSH-type Zn-finger protein